jgi:manganese/iron transport system permease protein/iron/zinc/copper transport system permease protein
LIGELLAPLEYEFFRNGLAVATMSGALCGLVGVYIVLKGMSYIGHGLAHGIFGGFAASSLLGVNAMLGAGAWGIASALMITTITRRRAVAADAAIGVITTASFALGLALVGLFGTTTQSFDALLFGSVMGVTPADVVLVAGVTLAAAAVLLALYRPLLFATFDSEVADASGVPTHRVDAVLMAVLAASILATMQVLGVTLIAAALVIPPTVARLLTSSFGRMLGLSVAIGAACGFVGMNVSYQLDVQSGPTIVLVGAVLFAIAVALTGTASRRIAVSDQRWSRAESAAGVVPRVAAAHDARAQGLVTTHTMGDPER